MSKLFSFSLKDALSRELRRLPLLQSLWAPASNSAVNNLNTLPLEIRTKKEITHHVATTTSKSGMSLKMSLNWAYAKELIRFYKHGVKTVWRNHKELRDLKKHSFRISGKLSNNGKQVDIRIPNFSVLAKELNQSLYMATVEKSKMSDGKSLVDHDSSVYPEKLFNLSRSQFLLFKRTPKDFYKLPTFSLIFAIFVEMTPLLCYAFPEITPSTCVLPSLLPRIYSQKNAENVREIATSALQSTSPEDYAIKSAYNLPPHQVQALADTLRLKTKYIPAYCFPISILRDRLHNHHIFLKVDNYYLSGLNGNGNVWDLAALEVVKACLDRNLIPDINELAKIEQLPVDEREDKLKLYIDRLRFALVQFIMNYENVGLLCVAEVPSTDVLALK